MKKRKILLDCTQTNLLENTVELQNNLPGIWLDEQNVEYRESEAVQVVLSFMEAGLRIERKSENHTRLFCCPKRKTKAWMQTEWGEFVFDVETDYISREAHQIEVQYRLSQNGMLIHQVRFCWKLKEEQA